MHHRYSLEKNNLVATFLIRRSGTKSTKEC
jgi:hypothetical protein